MNIPTDASALKHRFLDSLGERGKCAVDIARAVSLLEPISSEVSPRALVVGGFVRDAVLGRAPADLDMQVYGVAPAVLEALLERQFPERVQRVGAQYEILKVRLGRMSSIDVSIPRRGIGNARTPHEDGDPSISPMEAARLRDFTINSIAGDPLSGEILDPFGALDDLRAQSLRVTNPESFVTRGLHVYRAAQFAARFCLWPDAQCMSLLRSMIDADKPSTLTPRIITEELKKLFLKGRVPSRGAQVLLETGVIGRYFPALAPLLAESGAVERWLHQQELLFDESERRVADPEERLCCALAGFLLPVTALPDDALRRATLGLLCHLALSPMMVAAVVASLSTLRAIPEAHREWSSARAASSKAAPLPRMMRVAGRTTRLSFATSTDPVRRLCTRAYPATPDMLVSLHLAREGRTEVSRWLAGQLSGKVFSRVREPLLSRSDVIGVVGPRGGAEVGYIVSEVEKHRYSLITRDAALAFLSENREELQQIAASLAAAPVAENGR